MRPLSGELGHIQSQMIYCVRMREGECDVNAVAGGEEKVLQSPHSSAIV